MNTDTITDRVIAVDFGASLPNMIAAGKYDWVNTNITADKFPVEGAGKKVFHTTLFHFGCYISSEDAVAAMAPSSSCTSTGFATSGASVSATGTTARTTVGASSAFRRSPPLDARQCPRTFGPYFFIGPSPGAPSRRACSMHQQEPSSSKLPQSSLRTPPQQPKPQAALNKAKHTPLPSRNP
jgi:hypothetical protein